MSALECDRNNCDNIMCDRYSHEYGYICDDCFNELVSRGPMASVHSFMGSYKEPNQEEEARARFNITFSGR